MILELVEKKYQQFDSLALVNIDPDDAVNISKINITSPLYNHLNGTYKPWKYCDYGYVWSKNIPGSSISHLIFFNNKPDHKKLAGPMRNIADRYIYIYELDPSRTFNELQQIARGEIILKPTGEVCKWYVQDEKTLHWNLTSNISYQMLGSSFLY